MCQDYIFPVMHLCSKWVYGDFLLLIRLFSIMLLLLFFWWLFLLIVQCDQIALRLLLRFLCVECPYLCISSLLMFLVALVIYVGGRFSRVILKGIKSPSSVVFSICLSMARAL